MSKEKVAIIACAGMDKPLGSVARASAFKAVETKPEDSILVCIPPLVAGVNSHKELIKKHPVITIDGCAERCATKIAAKNGCKIRGRLFIPKSAQKYKLQPKSAADIGAEGEKLAKNIAEEIVLLIDKILRK